MNPKFSVIIPVYNVAPYLKECLDSVVAAAECFSRVERGGRVEIVCVDDGSTDGSSEILDSYLLLSLKTQTLKVIHKTNGGVSSARNRGLDEASGEWVLFLDGDDMLHPDCLARLGKAIESYSNVDTIRFGLVRFGDHEQVPWVKVEPEIEIEIQDVSEDMTGVPPYGFTCVAYRRKLLDGIQFGNQIVGEDVLFLAQYMDRVRVLAKMSCAFYGYRVREGSAILSPITERKLLDVISVAADILTIYNNSSKNVPVSYIRLQKNILLERVPSEWMLLDKIARQRVVARWREALAEISDIRAWLILHLSCLIPVLCRLPYCLKQKGLHR